jgi:cleavage and polyadenylation specificity factor subunit 2
MSDIIMKGFDERRENPFHFNSNDHIKLRHSLDELDKIPKPYVIVTSSSSLDMGFSRELFSRMCGDSRNLVLLTGFYSFYKNR